MYSPHNKVEVAAFVCFSAHVAPLGQHLYRAIGSGKYSYEGLSVFFPKENQSLGVHLFNQMRIFPCKEFAFQFHCRRKFAGIWGPCIGNQRKLFYAFHLVE